MAGAESSELAPANTKRKKSQKRKHRSASVHEEEEEAPENSLELAKIPRLDQSERIAEQANFNFEVNSAWKNLQLVLFLQDQKINILEKVDLAFTYVTSSIDNQLDDGNLSSQVLSNLRTLVFLNNWVQSVMISSEKKMKLEENKPEFGALGSCLDHRVFKILHFCLEEAKNLNISLACSRDFLRVIRWIVMDASLYVSSVCGEGTLYVERVEFYDVVLLCISLIFSFHGGVANENLDLWILLIREVLELILKIVDVQLDGCKLLDLIFKLSCVCLEPFSKFLQAHPTRKNGFHDFIDKLLEPLLHLLYVLRHSSYGPIIEWRTDMSKLVEEVLTQGLFHPTHLDGFLILQNIDKYKSYTDVPPKEEKVINRSYHRHLFDKVEKIVVNRNGSALVGLRELLQLFVNSVAKHKVALANGGGSRKSNVSSRSHVPDKHSQSRVLISDKMPQKHNMDAELRKSIFWFFVQVMEYLLADVNKYLQSFEEVVSLSSEFTSILRSINNLLASFMCEKIYLRTEDTSEGACKNFLRLIYDTIMSVSAKTSCIKASSFDQDEKSVGGPFISVKKELIITVHHLLEIEYEVLGDDLERTWTMLFASLACCYSADNALDQSVLLSEILSLSCRLIDIYSELRQVNSPIFALCRALRHSVSLLGGNEACASSFTNSLSMLLCSSEFRVSLSNAIKTIPEGQAAVCIRQLILDIKESLEWVKWNDQFVGMEEFAKSNQHSYDSVDFDLQAELLGKALSEAYAAILDSITVSSGNSTCVGASLKNLIEVIRPCLSSIVSLQQDGSKNFHTVVNKRILSKETGSENSAICWILTLIFRLLLSCRSLSRQVISLMPPDASKKMSEAIGDPLTAYSGRDWLEIPRSGKNFFSWISQPSAPLLDLLNSLGIISQDSAVACPPLVYASVAMTLQRLVDLNRLIKSFKYMLRWNRTQHTELRNDADILRCNKRISKWKKCFSLKKSFMYMHMWNKIWSSMLTKDADPLMYKKRVRRWKKSLSHVREEAVVLTKFLMETLSSVSEDRICTPFPDGGINGTFIQGLNDNNDALNFPLGSLDEKSLPNALWWIICQNVEVWCSHAAKKDVKNFLTRLIQASMPSMIDHVKDFRTFNTNSGHLKKVNPHEITLMFMRNTITFEQKLVRRYMASRFCRILQKFVSSIFDSSAVDLNKSPDWSAIISAIESFSDKQSGALPWIKRSMVPAGCDDKQTNFKFACCQFVISLLMRMPEEYLSSSSSSLYITCMVNLERFLVGILLGLHRVSCSEYHMIFQLFVSCRKVLKILISSSCKGDVNEGQPPISSKFLDCSFPLTWLVKSLSATIVCRSSFPDDIAFEAKVSIFSLMIHTSNALMAVSRNQFKHAISSLISARKSRRERRLLDPVTKGPNSSENKIHLNSKNLEACNSVLQLAETLADHMQAAVTTFVSASLDMEIEVSTGFQDFYNLSSIIACFQGLLWGLASAFGDTDDLSINFTVLFSSYNSELMTRLSSCVDAFMKFITLFLRKSFLENDLILNTSISNDNCLGARDPSFGRSDGIYDGPSNVEMIPTGKLGPSDAKSAASKRNTHPAIRDLEAFLKEVQGEGLQLKESFLRDCVRGRNAELASFLQQLFYSWSAILRLSLQIEITSISWSLFPAIVGISQFLLWEFSICGEMPNQFGFCCLDGVVRLLEELGTYFPHFDPSLSREFYVKLIDVHLRAIGKCISLQGKDAKLNSRGTGAQTNMLGDQAVSCFSLGRNQLDELKVRLRISFTTYVRGASELHLLSVVLALERALVGVEEGLTTNYEIAFGNSDGGKISPLVAAGIECVDIILEYATGQKRVNMIKSHIQGVVRCIFNIVLHLQAPNVFYGHDDFIDPYRHPDSGSVILMCIEVLTKVSAKPSVFHLDVCHIAQSLRVPAPLFQYFLQLQISGAPVTANDSTVDWKFSIELYAACCRLLCTTLKHHKNETWQCMSLLEDSVGALLQCLEIVNVDLLPRKCTFAWEVQKAVKCASNLRRVYEEIRQQKDVFRQSAFRLLSRYIWVYCGFGQAKNGIIREVDEALRPGLYALIDCCSAGDLQLLHTQFGEGSCRSTLAALQHDYKVNFRFEGKV